MSGVLATSGRYPRRKGTTGRVALGDCSPRAPTDPYVHFRAYGSSRCGFAVPHTTHPLCGDTLGGSMPSAWFRLLVHNAAFPSLHGVQEGLFPRFHDTMGRSDSPPSVSTRLNSSRADTIVSPVVCSPRSWASHRGPGSLGSGLPIRFGDGNVGVSQVPGEPWWSLSVLFDPGRTRRVLWDQVQQRLTRPPLMSTTKAPRVLSFRGSITRPLTWLSTLRRVGRPTTTQDSLLAAGRSTRQD